MLVLFRIIKVARNATTLQNSLIVYGVFAYILLHIMINLGGVMGVIPLTGVPLPFFSYGGTALFFLLCEMGVLLNISRAGATNK